MSPLIPRRRQTQFAKASDGSMTLMEHLRELRTRLFKACLGLLAGLVVCLFFADIILDYLNAPYCEYWTRQPENVGKRCGFNSRNIIDLFLLNLRVGLYAGLLVSAPVWLYQLWAFIAPGLHRNERRYTYYFVAAATPLFFAGAFLAFFVVDKGKQFLMGLVKAYNITLDISGYFDFVTSIMLLFGLGFEFPLAVVALNLLGVVSAKRLLGWWRIAVLLCFVFAAFVTPTPDPFGMTALAIPMSGLYFGAVGIAYLNDRRRGRNDEYANLADDEASSIEDDTPLEDAAPIADDVPLEEAAAIDEVMPIDGPPPVEGATAIDRPSPVDDPTPVSPAPPE
ncbi:MAG: twin-arginine translocase subunit TatC, partial [Dehalococcoidia bacterium]